MDESALRTLIASLETSSSSSHWWLEFWTLLVVVGVALEVVFVVWEYLEDLHDFNRGIVHPPDHPNRWLFVLGLLGAALVAGGVTGELNAESSIATVETRIRKANDDLYLLLSKEAGDAKTNSEIAGAAARTAKEDAKAAKDESDASIKELGKARGDISRLEIKSTNLDTTLSKTASEVDSVESKRAELERSLLDLAVCNSPRVLPRWEIGNKKTSVDLLRPFAGYKAFIEFVPDDAETRRAATHIAASLKAAQWEIAELAPTYEPVEDGIAVQPFAGPEDGSMAGAARYSGSVADVVVDFLHSYNWSAKRDFLLNPKLELIRDPKVIPPEGLRIRVGLYPAIPFVLPPGMTDVAQANALFEQNRANQMRENQERRRQMEEKFFKTLTPDEIRMYMARKQEEETEEKKREARYSNPCQPLVSMFPRP